MKSAIEVQGLTKHYRSGTGVVRALDGVDLAIGHGEFVAIVGRSGSGKTTLLDCLGLLLTPTSGTVRFEGSDVSRIRGDRRAALRGQRVGFVFQEFNLLAPLTALENVMLPLRYTRAPGDGRARALELLRLVGLADRSSHRPTQLSGGEQQRVAIARALINSPAVVLGDEPTGEVDSETSAQLVGLMREVNRERGVTFVIVTHDLAVAACADRVVRMQDGRVVTEVAGATTPAVAAAD